MATKHVQPLAEIRAASLTLGALATRFGLTALTAGGKWTQDVSKNDLEYFIEAKGMRLCIKHPAQNGSADALGNIALYAADTQKEVSAFTVTVGSNTYHAPFEAGSSVGNDNFSALLQDLLHEGDAVVRFGGETITFPEAVAVKA